MTAESIVPTVTGLRLPAGRAARLRQTAPTALLSVDLTAALLGALIVPEDQRHPLLVTLLILCSARFSRHRGRRSSLPLPSVLDELPALCGWAAVCWAIGAALAPEGRFPMDVLAAGCAVHCAVACAGRAAVYRARRQELRRRPWPALLVGPASTARSVAAVLLGTPGCGVRPVGIVSESRDVCPALDDSPGPPVLATGHEVQRAILHHGVTAVVLVGLSDRAGNAAVLRELARYGCVVWELDPDSPSYVLGGRQAGTGHLAGFACRLLSRGSGRSVVDTTAKRMLDVVLSGALLALACPVFLVRMALSRTEEGQGLMVREERIGMDGQPFELLRFRTRRRADVPHSGRSLRFLRHGRLDGLPQLWNVLRGDMSLVGPQPERPHRVAECSQKYPGYAARHRMRTGLTGLAQINGVRDDAPVEDRCRFDNAYIDTWSPWQDICILLRTVALSVRPTGS